MHNMKKYSFSIGRWDVEEIFSPIRNKKQCIRLLMKTLKIMMANQEVRQEDSTAEIVIVISKMSRIFYISEDKYFSIAFPFFVTETSEGLKYSSRYVEDIDSKLTSDVLGILSSSDFFESNCIYTFSDSIMDIDNENSCFWCFLRELMLFEVGYIRYDFDQENEDGALHPLNHYDISYSSNSTFKIGLRKRMHQSDMIDFLNTLSNCHFLDAAEIQA